MAKTIHLNESKLRQIIKESVKKILKETIHTGFPVGDGYMAGGTNGEQERGYNNRYQPQAKGLTPTQKTQEDPKAAAAKQKQENVKSALHNVMASEMYKQIIANQRGNFQALAAVNFFVEDIMPKAGVEKINNYSETQGVMSASNGPAKTGEAPDQLTDITADNFYNYLLENPKMGEQSFTFAIDKFIKNMQANAKGLKKVKGGIKTH